MSDIVVLQVVAITAVAGTFASVLKVVSRYLESRRQAPGGAALAAVHERLARIEQIVETTAVEVERIAEANRYLAKVLAERGAPAIPPQRSERVITPH